MGTEHKVEGGKERRLRDSKQLLVLNFAPGAHVSFSGLVSRLWKNRVAEYESETLAGKILRPGK